MKSKKAVAILFSIAFVAAWILTGSAASARDNILVLQGRLVNAACDARVLGLNAQPSEFKSLKVNANLSLGLMSHDDACAGAALPVSAAYAERASINSATHSAIVTLTYQ